MFKTKVYPVDCAVFEGLCNRINAIVSASAVQEEINIYWAINKHCPVMFSDLFHAALPWRVFDISASSFPYSSSVERINWFYLCNPASLAREEFEPAVKRGYRQVIDRLKHRPSFALPEKTFGISYRTHLPKNNQEKFATFIERVEGLLEEKSPSSIFVASDDASSKDELCRHFEKSGLSTCVVNCALLDSDFDRSAANLIGLSKELVLFSQCDLGIAANTDRSTIPDSARGFGIPVFRPRPLGKYRKRNKTLERWIDESNFHRN